MDMPNPVSLVTPSVSTDCLNFGGLSLMSVISTYTNIQRENNIFYMNVWDFGGQEIMHATHKFFMTKRSIYVLVINPRIEDNHGDSDLEYWIKLIKSYAAQVPIIVVINKCETHPITIEENTLPKVISFTRNWKSLC